MLDFVFVCWDGRSCEDETAEIFRVIYIMPDGIPKDGGDLPFVDQSRPGTRQDAPGIHPRHGDIVVSLPGLRHVDHALGDLFGGCCLPTPLGPLDQDGPRPFKFALKK
jgi:hypothetical protein